MAPDFDHLLHLLQRRLEAKILVHRQEEAGLLRAPPRSATQSSQSGANGFCTIVGTLWRKAISASATMRVHARDDVDQTELALAEHRLRVGVPMRHAERLRRRLRLGRIDVADRDEVGALRREVLPGIQVIAGKEPAADHPD